MLSQNVPLEVVSPGEPSRMVFAVIHRTEESSSVIVDCVDVALYIVRVKKPFRAVAAGMFSLAVHVAYMLP